MRAALRAGQGFRGRLLNRARTGREYWLDLDIQPLHDTRGRLTGFVSLAGFDINAQASLTDARDRSKGAASYDNLLPRRARSSGRVDVDRSFGPLRVGITAAGSGHRFDNAANSVRLAGYGTVDLRVEYALNDAWSVQARAANVFDRDYETVAWYNQPGREYQLTLRYRSK